MAQAAESPALPNPTAQALPTWDDVPSHHPPNATDRPLPVLVVTADGTHCFKQWLDPRYAMRMGIREGVRVVASPNDVPDHPPATPIQCPDRAAQVLEERGHQPDPPPPPLPR